MINSDDKFGSLRRFIPGPGWSKKDRRQWRIAQISAHLALLVVMVVAALLVHALLEPEEELLINREFFLGILDLLVPGLVFLHVLAVPSYMKYLGGEQPLWKFFAIPLIVAGVGLCMFPLYWLALSAFWGQLMLAIVGGIAGLMMLGMLLMHGLFRLLHPEGRR